MSALTAEQQKILDLGLIEHRNDSKHVVLSGTKMDLYCEDCGAPLITVWETQKNEKLKFTIVARCGHCGDKSSAIKVSGAFQYGQLGVTNPEHPENTDMDLMYTDIDNVEHLEMEDKSYLVLFTTIRTKEWTN